MIKTIFLFLLLPLPVLAITKPLDVVINEVAWMGTKSNSSDEWIELFNNTNDNIDLNGWSLYENETLIEPLTGIIKANSYYLIERTDDSTIQNIAADQEPSGWGGYGLNNNGENLKLINKELIIIDEISCSNGWFAGESSPDYKTMERINSQEIGLNNNWKTSFSISETAVDSQGNSINGSPGSKNSVEPSSEKDIIASKKNINEETPLPKTLIKEEIIEENPQEETISLTEEIKENKEMDKDNFINVFSKAFLISILFSFLFLKFKKIMKKI